jgi:rod shape determining protein RodA
MYEYQKSRVLSFFSPNTDALGTGYHLAQSKISLGSGGLFGKGYMNGTQSQLDFLQKIIQISYFLPLVKNSDL